MQIIVKFNEPKEFCDELRKDAALVDRKIVRVTNLFKMSSMLPNIHHVLVVASYSVEGQLIRLERYCGDLWKINQEADDEVIAKTRDVHKEVEDMACSLGLEVRSGSAEEAETN